MLLNTTEPREATAAAHFSRVSYHVNLSSWLILGLSQVPEQPQRFASIVKNPITINYQHTLHVFDIKSKKHLESFGWRRKSRLVPLRLNPKIPVF